MTASQRHANLLLAVLLVMLAAPARAFQVEEVPNPRGGGGGWVSDPLHRLSDPDRAAIEARLTALERDTRMQMGVAIIDHTAGQSPKAFATALFNHWGIGHRDTQDGVLLLVVLDARRSEVEVGHALEDTLAPYRIEQTLTRSLVPLMRVGQISGGVRAGAEAIADLSREVYFGPAHGLLGQLGTKLPVRLFGFPFLMVGTLAAIVAMLVLWACGLPGTGAAHAALGEGGHGLARVALVVAGFALGVCTLEMLRDPSAGTSLCALPALFAFLIALPFAGILSLRTSSRCGFLLGGLPQVAAAVGLFMMLVTLVTDQGASLSAGCARGASGVLPVGALGLGAGWLALRRLVRRLPPVCGPCNRTMEQLDEKEDDRLLSRGERREEALGSVDYDVWVCGGCQAHETRRYASWFTFYLRCAHCKSLTAVATSRTLVAATRWSSGEGERITQCESCGHRDRYTYTIARETDTSTSSSSSSSSGGSSDWGGGSSSGSGGGGASW